MSRAAELAELHHLAGTLRRVVSSLQQRYEEAPTMRRLVLDADRILADLELLESDAAELEMMAGPGAHSGEKIQVPDTPYDSEFWRDVDDEGVGGHFRR
jgi:hypothetical protein